MKASDAMIAHNTAQQWLAHLELGFVGEHKRTILKHRKHIGPVRVQKMLWPEKTGVCHAIIVHPPAGIAGGDHLRFTISVAAHGHAVLTTPGAGKWYRSNAKPAYQSICLSVEDNSCLEWLPQETMLFDGACASTQTHIELSEQASFIGWDMLVIGRQARQECFEQGQYHSQFRLNVNGQVLVTDCLNFSGNDRFLSSCLGMNGQAVLASFWAVAPLSLRNAVILQQQIELIRELMVRMKAAVTLTLVNSVICARFLGNDVRQCHDAFAAIRARLRGYWFALDEEFPRIWRT